tara:strand:- start:83 stop:1639 length:1557 start_codon:yes stop_codon:yes gene_type:complete
MAKETLNNGSVVEITSGNFTVSSESVKPRSSERTGRLNEKKRFTITGRAELNKKTNIGTLKLTAAENKRFVRKPGISKRSDKGIVLNSKIVLRLKNVERDTKGRITEYLYEMTYTGKESVSVAQPLKYKLNNKTISLVSKATGIERIICGNSDLSPDGERRKITIHGTPGTTFKIAVTRIEESKYGNIYADVDDGSSSSVATYNHIIDAIETDILNSVLSNSTENLTASGAEMSIISDKIPKSGKYSFMQNFPKLELVKATAINESGAASGATRIIFDSLTDVVAGDLVTVNGLTTTVQTVNPTGSNANQCDLTTTITGANNTHAEFRRITKYSINVLPSKLKRKIDYLVYNRPGWENGWYSKTLKHLFKPKLIIRATSNSVLYTINRYTIPGGASAQTYDRRFIFNSRAATDRRRNVHELASNYHKVVYTLRALSNSHSFSVLKTPVANDFGTATIRSGKTNGGTFFEIQNISAPVLSNTQGWANDTATITFHLRISAWGETDTVLETALNAFVGCS